MARTAAPSAGRPRAFRAGWPVPLNAQPCSETFNRRERASCLGMAKEAPLDPALVSEQKGGKEVRIEKGREEPAKPGMAMRISLC